MQLITEELIQDLPDLYETEDIKNDEKLLLLRFYEPNTQWQWYLCEYSDEDKRGFGYVMGYENEWGYFSLEEMEAIYTIKRDEEFKPIKFKNLKR